LDSIEKAKFRAVRVAEVILPVVHGLERVCKTFMSALNAMRDGGATPGYRRQEGEKSNNALIIWKKAEAT